MLENIRNNNFTLLRVILALLVVFSHSWPMTLGTGTFEPPYPLLPFSFGTLAVYAFFGLSGFLVTKSLLTRKGFIEFLKARILRIYPALFFALCLTVLIGLFCSNISWWTYLQSPDTIMYIIQNLTFQNMNIRTTLPGCFLKNPYPNAVNAPIWTLPYELLMYIFLAVAGLCGLTRRNKPFIILLVIAIIAASICIFLNVGRFLTISPKIFDFTICFMTGSLLFISNCEHRKPNGCFVLTLILISALTRFTSCFMVVVLPTIVFCVIWLSLTPVHKLTWLNRFGDPSYGIYVYAFPIQQAFVQVFGIRNPLHLFLAAGFVALVFGMLSWHLLEKRCLSLKGKRLVVSYFRG